ncbi:hypothetical protein HDV00_004615 [Rhizophlyctis rosea]|nr:hypothetical protein HDV00_004615 [Rhizophlyctis rosea]
MKASSSSTEPVAVILCDPDGVTRYWSPEAHALFDNDSLRTSVDGDGQISNPDSDRRRPNAGDVHLPIDQLRRLAAEHTPSCLVKRRQDGKEVVVAQSVVALYGGGEGGDSGEEDSGVVVDGLQNKHRASKGYPSPPQSTETGKRVGEEEGSVDGKSPNGPQYQVIGYMIKFQDITPITSTPPAPIHLLHTHIATPSPSASASPVNPAAKPNAPPSTAPPTSRPNAAAMIEDLVNRTYSKTGKHYFHDLVDGLCSTLGTLVAFVGQLAEDEYEEQKYSYIHSGTTTTHIGSAMAPTGAHIHSLRGGLDSHRDDSPSGSSSEEETRRLDMRGRKRGPSSVVGMSRARSTAGAAPPVAIARLSSVPAIPSASQPQPSPASRSRSPSRPIPFTLLTSSSSTRIRSVSPTVFKIPARLFTHLASSPSGCVTIQRDLHSSLPQAGDVFPDLGLTGACLVALKDRKGRIVGVVGVAADKETWVFEPGGTDDQAPASAAGLTTTPAGWCTFCGTQPGKHVPGKSHHQCLRPSVAEQVLEALKPRIQGELKRSNELMHMKVESAAAIAATKSKTHFLANMSHEIRTPVSAIIGLTDMVLWDAQAIPEEHRNKLELISSSGEHLLAVINDILDLSKIGDEDVKFTLQERVMGIRRCVKEAVQLASMSPYLAKKKVVIVEGNSSPTPLATLIAEKQKQSPTALPLCWKVDASVPEFVVGDVTRLRQVVLNLLSNALKFTSVGSVVATVTRIQDPDASEISGGNGAVEARPWTEDAFEGRHEPKVKWGRGNSFTGESSDDPTVKQSVDINPATTSVTASPTASPLDHVISVPSPIPIPQPTSTTTTTTSTPPLYTTTPSSPSSANLTPNPSQKPRHVSLLFTVVDTGCGIPGEKISRLFIPFSQIDNEVTRGSGVGTGLGLAISSRLVEMMGGHIWVESSEGVGSKFAFIIRFPLADGSAGGSSDQESEKMSSPVVRPVDGGGGGSDRSVGEEEEELKDKVPIIAATTAPGTPLLGVRSDGASVNSSDGERTPEPNPGMGVYSAQSLTRLKRNAAINRNLAVEYPIRILVAEDNMINQQIALSVLKKMGYNADLAANGKEVLDKIDAGENYDLILMDVCMPFLDGLECTRELVARRKTKPKSHSGVSTSTTPSTPTATPPSYISGTDLSTDSEIGSVIIALTASATTDDRLKCEEAGMHDWLAKPFKALELQDKIAMHFGHLKIGEGGVWGGRRHSLASVGSSGTGGEGGGGGGGGFGAGEIGVGSRSSSLASFDVLGAAGLWMERNRSLTSEVGDGGESEGRSGGEGSGGEGAGRTDSEPDGKGAYPASSGKSKEGMGVTDTHHEAQVPSSESGSGGSHLSTPKPIDSTSSTSTPHSRTNRPRSLPPPPQVEPDDNHPTTNDDNKPKDSPISPGSRLAAVAAEPLGGAVGGGKDVPIVKGEARAILEKWATKEVRTPDEGAAMEKRRSFLE